jgi:membrane protease YdiL (CAAX protease family)
MPFASVLRTGQLPEKPWRVDAVVRLLTGIFVCLIMGSVVAAMIHYFGEMSRKPGAHDELFLAGSIGAIACFGGALFVLGRPWPFEKHLRNLIILLTCIYGGFLLMWWTGRLSGDEKGELQSETVKVLLAVVTFQGAAIALVHFFLREHHTNWREGFGLGNRPAQSLLIGVCVGILVLFPAWILQDLSIRLFKQLTFHPQEQQAVAILRHTAGWAERVLLGVAMIFAAPIGEEIIFRGVLYPWIKRIGHPQLALWITAILFGLIHFNLASFVPLTLLAVVLVGLYEYTGNLLAPIAVHCVFNAANFVALYLQQN